MIALHPPSVGIVPLARDLIELAIHNASDGGTATAEGGLAAAEGNRRRPASFSELRERRAPGAATDKIGHSSDSVC